MVRLRETKKTERDLSAGDVISRPRPAITVEKKKKPRVVGHAFNVEATTLYPAELGPIQPWAGGGVG